jgi:hypothetical protein
MAERIDETPHLDSTTVLRQGVVPAVLTIVGMAIGFSLVFALLFFKEGLVVANLGSRLLALAVMYVVPQFLVGLWTGTRHGLSIGPPIAAGLAPIAFLLLSLGAFGGPVFSPLGAPLLTLGVVVVWSLVCACGQVVGARVLAPRLGN